MRSDTLHDRLFIEHKHSARHAIINLWDKIKPLASKEGKRPVVTLSVKSRLGFWVMCHSSDLVVVAGEVASNVQSENISKPLLINCLEQ